ncbi:Uncharacterised protein [Mycobacteroides abscessus subsp. abscessus]|nr:Uncharacterised protein [Mycobacteroides abscessus subsp. abscessus]
MSISAPTSSPLPAAFWTKGGNVTNRSACGLAFSLAIRDTTSAEPASTRFTEIPVI